MLVSDKQTEDPTVHAAATGLRRSWSRLNEYFEGKSSRYISRRGSGLFSPSCAAHFRPNEYRGLSGFDVICLYWITGAFIAPEGLKGLSQPVIWRLSDVWPFTGGCHYPASCENFTEDCGNCPKLVHSGTRDASRRLVERKKRAWSETDITVVAPSNWMAKLASRSALFKDRNIVSIATGIDTAVFAPRGGEAARSRLGIPAQSRLVVFGADGATSDPRKGIEELRKALSFLSNDSGPHTWHLAVFGSGHVPDLPLPSCTIGHVSNPSELAEIYSCADVVAVPSKEDNLPQVALEAMSCGTPVVAFRVGGLADAVIHGQTGWLAAPGDAQDFALGLLWALTAGEEVRGAARQHITKNFALDVQLARYANLVKEVNARAKRQMV